MQWIVSLRGGDPIRSMRGGEDLPEPHGAIRSSGRLPNCLPTPEHLPNWDSPGAQ